MDERKAAILNDLKGALAMVGQAQERCTNQSSLWKTLGKLFDEIDGVTESVNDDDYDI